MPSPPHARALLLSAIAGAAVAAVWALGPIPQDPAYHVFADDRAFWGIPNFWNTISSLPLALLGLAGLVGTGTAGGIAGTPQRLFFLGLLGAGLGSAWYHLAPDNGRLLWDRLGMTLAFAGFVSIVAFRVMGPAPGRRLALPLAVFGCASVLYWYAGERVGAGDLRPYVIVQFLPLLIVPAMLLLYAGAEGGGRPWIAAALLCYVIAKALEAGDALVMGLGGWISGHTLKHLSAASGALCVLVMLRRHPAPADSGDQQDPRPP
ncbi:MAG: alkaline phytoceramidase [Chromatiales bacterium]|jgi:hypothetical protein